MDSNNLNFEVQSENQIEFSTETPDLGVADTPTADNEPAPKGLSKEEYNDPNKIQVHIDDEQTPLVVLFGPPACGKTMTLIRLVRFLQTKGYTVEPVRTFRPSDDSHYKTLCDGFNELIGDNEAARSTDRISYLLVKVLKNGKPICQILESPGEYLFNPRKPDQDFPRYVNYILNCKNRKLLTIMVEPDWRDPSDRMKYVAKINNKLLKKARIKGLVVFNKIDITPYVGIGGHVNVSEARRYVKNLYPGIFEGFRNHNPITKWWKEYLCDFLPFSTGDYSKADDNVTIVYDQSDDIYPTRLWNKILKGVVTGW